MPRAERKPLSKADLIAHPVRLRIIMTMAGQQLTPGQIAATLPDVPQATLYRHINRLAEAGILRIVEEIPVRGTVERVYALSEGAGRLEEADLAHASREDHLRYFAVFFASLMSWLRGYLQQETIDPKADGLTCRGATLQLTDAEYQELMTRIGALIQPVTENPATDGRRRRVVAWVAIPGPRDSLGGAETPSGE